MFRLLAVVVLFLLAGCVSPSTSPIIAEEMADSWRVMATRVEPQNHVLVWTGQLAARPCASDGSEACRGAAVRQAGITAGISWDEPTIRFLDGEALFWRLNLEVSWHSDHPLMRGLQFEVRAIQDCADCSERVIETFNEASPLLLENYDVFPTDGETGVRLVVRAPPGALMETAWGSAAVTFRIDGIVAGFRPAAPPVVLS